MQFKKSAFFPTIQFKIIMLGSIITLSFGVVAWLISIAQKDLTMLLDKEATVKEVNYKLQDYQLIFKGLDLYIPQVAYATSAKLFMALLVKLAPEQSKIAGYSGIEGKEFVKEIAEFEHTFTAAVESLQLKEHIIKQATFILGQLFQAQKHQPDSDNIKGILEKIDQNISNIQEEFNIKNQEMFSFILKIIVLIALGALMLHVFYGYKISSAVRNILKNLHEITTGKTKQGFKGIKNRDELGALACEIQDFETQIQQVQDMQKHLAI